MLRVFAPLTPLALPFHSKNGAFFLQYGPCILSICDWVPEPAATSSGDELARWRWHHMLLHSKSHGSVWVRESE